MVCWILSLVAAPMSWLVTISDAIDDVWDLDDPLLRDETVSPGRYAALRH